MKSLGAFQDFLASARDVAGDAVQATRDISNSPHMAPIHALIRQGADEMAQVLPAFPDSNVRPQSEMGQMFEITPGMATEQIKGKQPEKEPELEME